MAFRIGSHVVRGELINTKRTSVFGWIDFGGDWGVRVEVTGNFSGELAGQHLRFLASQPTTEADGPRSDLNQLADNQIGVVGEMVLRTLADGKSSLYLEWFSQNGRVVAELAEPILEYGPEELPVTEHEELESLDAEMQGDDVDFLGTADLGTGDPGGDPYQLFPADLEDQLQQSNDDVSPSEYPFLEETPDDGLRQLDDPTPRKDRPWDEVIPGLDPETKRMYEEWDEVFDGTKDVPITSLFDPPLTLKRPADIADEAEATEALKTLLARLALHCVAIHVCHHFTPAQTYEWLMDDLLPEEGVHPKLGPTGYVRHYDTSEECAECNAEFEASWNAKNES